MVLRMARPTRRPGSNNSYLRKRVPADVLRIAQGQSVSFTFPGESPDEREVVSVVTIAPVIKVSLRTRDPALTRLRHGLALSQFERVCEAFRKGPQALTKRQIVVLSGLIYRKINQAFHDDAVDANWWQTVQEVVDNALSSPLDDLLIGGNEAKTAARLKRLERYVGPFVDGVLRSEGAIIDAASRSKLLVEAARALKEVAAQLKRNAEGDYRPDPNAERFPKWEGLKLRSQGSPHSTLTFDGLFERWQRETKPAPSTITTWRSYINALRNHIGHDDPARVTKADLIAWKDALVAAGRSPKGIKDGQLAAVRALFNFAVDNGLLPSNPALGVTVRQSKSAGTRMLPYSDDEVARLLALADRQPHPCRRWLPWLMALSGARVGELAQLWGRRIIHVDGIPVMKIAPAEDGGSLKNEGSERDVPIHPALIERGFLEFVRSRGDGPLFYGKKRLVKSQSSPSSGRRHASKGIANHLAAWIRNEGFTDKRKAPNHAFRHWFKTACLRAGVDPFLADVIQVACTRFRRHQVWCDNGTGGGSWSGGSLRESSSLRPCA
jgi:integrase